MAKITYFDLINGLINNNTIKIFGRIDLNVLKQQRVESLYYSFPLIEKIILEIYKLIPSSDVEHYEQGTMKTLNSIMNSNNEDIVCEDLKNKIDVYFNENNGIRNIVLHVKEEIMPTIQVSFVEIVYIIMCLLSIFNRVYNDYDPANIHKIDLLPIE